MLSCRLQDQKMLSLSHLKNKQFLCVERLRRHLLLEKMGFRLCVINVDDFKAAQLKRSEVQPVAQQNIFHNNPGRPAIV